VDWDDVSNTPTTLAGYGITDAFTETESDARFLGINATAVNSDKVDGYNVQVDGTGTDPNTIYFKTTGGTISVDWDDVANTPTTVSGYGITDAVTTSGNQTIGGTKTFSSTITGSITGNAGTVTNGVYTSGDQTIGGTKTFSSTISGSIDGNSNTVDGYHVQVDGTGTDPNTIYFKTTGGSIGVDWDDISNTPTTVAGYGITDAVTTSGNQTIGGTKTFSSDVILSGGTANGVLYLTGSKYVTSGSTLVFNGSQLGINVSSPSYSLDVAGTFNIASNGSSNTATINHTSGSGIALNISKGGAHEAIYVNKTSGSGNAVTVVGTVQATSFVGALTGNASTVTNGVYTTGDQTIGGTKTFSSTISGSISGNAGTATTLQAVPTINNVTFAGNANITIPRVRALDDRTLAPADGSANYVTAYFTSWANDNTSPYADALLFRTYGDGSGGSDNLVTFRKNAIGMRIWQQTFGSATAFSSFKDVAWTDGTNATGTWSISTSGNAGTVTNGVYTTGDQTIGGTKSFSTSPIYSDTGFQYHQHTSAHIAYIKKTGAYNWYWRRNDSGLIGGANEANLMELFDNGSLSAYGDMRAPVFYDFSNTAYYLDPANTGTSMVVAGDIVASNLKTSANTALSLGLSAGTAFNTGGSAISLRGSTTGYNDSGMEFYAGNSERMRINSSGNVGIGTTSPSNRLHVSSTSAPILAENSGGGSYMVDMKATTGSFNVRLGNGGDAFLLNVNNAERMRVDSAGRVLVGAGATASLGKLVVSEASSGTAVIALESQGSWNSTIACTSTGNLVLRNNSASDRMVFDPYGNVFVNGTMYSPIYYDKDNSAFYLDANNTGTSLNVAGSIVAAGNVTAYSDIRVKDNVENITDAIGKLNQIRGVTYTRTDLDDKNRRFAGVIAQEIEQVLPEAVFDNGKVKAVDYNATIALLIEAIKEQQGQINELKLTIEQLKGN
jgi:hypothetical protein